ncbi:MAG: ATP-binding protein [Burkholderiaceae bacterium]|jgi:ATP-dependent DNA helicase RecG
MLTPEFVQQLLSDLESDRVERTVSTTNTDKFAQAICAFGNDYPGHRQPGYLMVGAADDGSLSGLTVTDELLRNLAAIRSDGNVLPPPAMTVEKVVLPAGELAVVTVQPSTVPPVRYKGRVHIRIGPRKGIASEQEERILSERRASLLTTFDAQPVPDASLGDLTMRLFDEYRMQTVDAEVIEANHRTTEEKLASLRCFDLRAGRPTVAGLLLFGTNPRYFLPGAYVQFLRFPGTTLTDRPDDEREISGDMRTIVETVRQKIVAFNAVQSTAGEGFRDQPRPDYPEWALRELFHNAVIHRDYQSNTPIRFYWFSDRIEIQSPGGLYGEVTAATLTRRNSYRNPVIAEAMKAMDYVNRYGYGIQRAQDLLAANGNPPAEFEIDDRVFLVTLRRRPA